MPSIIILHENDKREIRYEAKEWEKDGIDSRLVSLTPEQLLADHKREREENEKRINSPEYKAKEEEYMRKATQKFISDNF